MASAICAKLNWNLVAHDDKNTIVFREAIRDFRISRHVLFVFKKKNEEGYWIHALVPAFASFKSG